MSKLSIEQRAHDLSLLTLEITANAKINKDGNITVDLLNEYIKNYTKAKSTLEKASEKFPDLFTN